MHSGGTRQEGQLKCISCRDPDQRAVGAHATHPLHTTVVQLVGSLDGGQPVRLAVDVPLWGDRAAEEDVLGESAILRIRHLLEQHRLSGQNCAFLRGLLESNRLLLRSSMIVDATTIDVPPSTKAGG